MCKELNEELERGDKAAKRLGEHLLAMGSASFEKTIVIHGAIVKITATVIARS